MSLISIVILLATAGAGALLGSRRLANATLWKAAITPLASIIGSGFLIIGPVLVSEFGSQAWIAMGLLCILGYAFGSAIRFNIRVIAVSNRQQGRLEYLAEDIASWALAFAYVISVAYYLNLLGSFSARIVGPDTGSLARIITTGTFVLILVSGIWRGFAILERMEQVAVSIKLAIIGGLTAGLAVYMEGKWQAGSLANNAAHWDAVEVLPLVLGLLVTVQGFETSRYLGETYSPDMRVRSMKLAQWTASVIYIVYVGLLAVSFDQASFALTETAVIDLMVRISPLLSSLLIFAALSAQFSAAVADTGGAGGLFEELTVEWVTSRHGYAVVAILGIVLTWSAHVFEIISYASRAFALYYMMQAALAAMRAYTLPFRLAQRIFLTASFGILCLLGLAIVLFGLPVE